MDPEIGGGNAGSAVTFLLVKLDAFATGEWNMQKTIRRAVLNLRRELRSIEALLRDHDASEIDPDYQFNILTLDLFRLDQESVWRRFKMSHSINNFIQDIGGSLQSNQRYKMRRSINNLIQDIDGSLQSIQRFKMLHSIHNLIQDIEVGLHSIQRSTERYQTMTFTRIHSAGNNTDLHVRVAPLFNGNLDTLLGIEEPTDNLVSWALEEKQRLEIMFVVGMAGLGKTTLVQSLYERVK